MEEEKKVRYIDLTEEEQAEVRKEFYKKCKVQFKKWGWIVVVCVLILGMIFAFFTSGFFGTD